MASAAGRPMPSLRRGPRRRPPTTSSGPEAARRAAGAAPSAAGGRTGPSACLRCGRAQLLRAPKFVHPPEIAVVNGLRADRLVVVQLKRLGNLLNQLVRRCHARDEPMPPLLAQVLDDLRAILERTHLGGKVPVQVAATTRAAIQTMVDDCIGIIAQDAAVALMAGLRAAGLDCSRRSLRSVAGDFDEVREVFSGRCSRSTNSISSSRLSRSRSLRPIPRGNQRNWDRARAWVITEINEIEIDRLSR